MEKYSPLRTLGSPVENDIICVRVTRLWYHRGGADRGPIKDIHMVLVDRQGDTLHAFVPHGFLKKFIDVLHETNVYEISNFLLVKKQEVMRPVDAPFAIKFSHSTVVQLKEELSGVLPEWTYSLTPFSNLPVPTVEPGCLIDVIGTICSVSDIEHFNLPRNNGVLVKRHVNLRDLSGHEIKIVLWGNCALRFNGNTIRALGQTESAVAIFVGTTTQEYDDERGLSGMAACSWYINEDIVDINIFRASLEGVIQPIAHAALPHSLPRRTQVGDNWPKKHVIQMAAFNHFENKDFKFRCTVTLSRVHSNKRWWYSACHRCHRLARPTSAIEHTYTCSDSRCLSTNADITYFLTVVGYDQTDEAEFTFFGDLAEQVTGNSIYQLIRNNQPSGPPIVNHAVAASRVCFPPPEVSRILGNRYRLVVSVTQASFFKPQTTFRVSRIEAVIPKARRLSSVDTIIPATSWDIDTPMAEPGPFAQNSSADESGPSNHVNSISTEPGPSAHNSFAAEPGPSNQVNNIPAELVVVIPTNSYVIEASESEFAAATQRADNYRQRVVNKTPKVKEETSAEGEIKTVLDRRGMDGDATHQ